MCSILPLYRLKKCCKKSYESKNSFLGDGGKLGGQAPFPLEENLFRFLSGGWG